MANWKKDVVMSDDDIRFSDDDQARCSGDNCSNNEVEGDSGSFSFLVSP